MSQAFFHSVLALGRVGLVGLLLGAVSLLAQPADASTEESRWFAGEWTVTPAPVEGFDDIASATISTVRIDHLGAARIARRSPSDSGRPSVTVEFTVKKVGGNFPWWPAQGPAVVTRKVTEDSFDLATVGSMGRADWSRALRHTRVTADAKPSVSEAGALQPGFVQILVNHVKPDRQADFELWLHDYRLMVERLIADRKLSEAEQRAYAAWRILAPDNETLAMSIDAGLPLQYLFLFDPMVAGVSYDLRHYLERALTPAEAAVRLAALQELLAEPQSVLSGVPL